MQVAQKDLNQKYYFVAYQTYHYYDGSSGVHNKLIDIHPLHFISSLPTETLNQAEQRVFISHSILFWSEVEQEVFQKYVEPEYFMMQGESTVG